MYCITSDWCVPLSLTYQCTSSSVHPALTAMLIRLEMRQLYIILVAILVCMRCQNSMQVHLLQDSWKRATVKLFCHKQILHTDMMQTSSLWRRMLGYRSMPHNKKLLIMHFDYREALHRRCCAWSRSMADGCAAAGTRCFWCRLKLISNLSCIVSTAPQYITIWIILTKTTF